MPIIIAKGCDRVLSFSACPENGRAAGRPFRRALARVRIPPHPIGLFSRAREIRSFSSAITRHVCCARASESKVCGAVPGARARDDLKKKRRRRPFFFFSAAPSRRASQRAAPTAPPPRQKSVEESEKGKKGTRLGEGKGEEGQKEKSRLLLGLKGAKRSVGGVCVRVCEE